MEDTKNPAVELEAKFAEISTAKATEAADAAIAKSAEAIEATKAEVTESFNNEVSELKSQNEILQKQMDEIKNNAPAIVKSVGTKSELFEKLAEAKETYKKHGKSEMELKTFVATDGSAHQPYAYDGSAEIQHDPNYKNRLRAALPTSTSDAAGSFIFNREVAETDAAAPKAKGAAQPQTSKTLQRQEAAFQTMTNLFTIPEEWLDDTARMENYLSRRLMGDLMDVEDRQIIGGNGTAPNLNGLNTFGTDIDTDGELGDWANSIAGANRYDAITALASILAQSDYMADTVVLNPFDYYQLKLIKATTNEYVLGQTKDGYDIYNGMKFVINNAQSANTFTVLDSKAVEYVMREGVNVKFDYNANDFASNNITVRAQLRGALVDYLPNGVLTGSFTGADGVVTLIGS